MPWRLKFLFLARPKRLQASPQPSLALRLEPKLCRGLQRENPTPSRRARVPGEARSGKRPPTAAESGPSAASCWGTDVGGTERGAGGGASGPGPPRSGRFNLLIAGSVFFFFLSPLASSPTGLPGREGAERIPRAPPPTHLVRLTGSKAFKNVLNLK